MRAGPILLLTVAMSIAGRVCGANIDSIAQQAYLKGSNTGMFDYFGQSVAVDGDTLVVGAPLEARPPHIDAL